MNRAERRKQKKILKNQGKSSASDQNTAHLTSVPAEQINSLVGLSEQGHFQEVLELTKQLLERFPNDSNLYLILGDTYANLQDVDKAITAYLCVLKINPQLAMAHDFLGGLYKGSGNLDEAENHYRAAIRINPKFSAALTNLSDLIFLKGDADEAETLAREALKFDPDLAEAHINLARALRKKDLLDQAEQSLKTALRLRPDYPEALNNLGNVYKETSREPDAIACYQAAISSNPQFSHAHFSLGIALLLMGDFTNGFKEYEWRVQFLGERYLPSAFKGTVWSDQPSQNKSIMVFAEQGLGDAIQFVRFLPLLAEQGYTVYLRCKPPLVSLFENVPGIEGIYTEDQPVIETDERVLMMSLPLLLGLTAETIPSQVPYIPVNDDIVKTWKDRLTPHTGLRVGLVWRGISGHANDHQRSCSRELFARHFNDPDVNYFSFQKELPDFELSGDDVFIGLGTDFETFVDTASAMLQMDLIVSVDTSIVHLAGALGVPCIVLLATAPDWRWMLGREDSPWYPSLKLFRQTERGNWDEILQRVASHVNGLKKSPA